MTDQPYEQRIDSAVLLEVIVTTIARRGEGREESDPIRIVTQVWTLDGKLIAERDPMKD